MKISIDGGSLIRSESNKYGNQIVAANLINALLKNDTNNEYTVYKNPSTFWKISTAIAEYKNKKDIFLALNQYIPAVHPANVLSFSHGLSFHFFPELYPDSASKMERQVTHMIRHSSRIVVSSEKVAKEFKNKYGYSKTIVIPFGIPNDMVSVSSKRKKGTYFMFVGMNHPIKNVEFVLKAFSSFKKMKTYENYSLLMVGNFPNTMNGNGVVVKSTIDRRELKKLYRNALAYLSASHYESFNLPVLEALSQECPVIGLSSAIIPELNKYVDIVNTEASFVKQMVSHSIHDHETQRYELLEMFSWDSYAMRVISLYDSL